jgi:hypothetical protein
LQDVTENPSTRQASRFRAAWQPYNSTGSEGIAVQALLRALDADKQHWSTVKTVFWRDPRPRVANMHDAKNVGNKLFSTVSVRRFI